jgi:hypothetical protein
MLLAGWLLTLQRLRRRETVLRRRSDGTATVAFGPGAGLPTLRDLLATMGFRVKAGTPIQGRTAAACAASDRTAGTRRPGRSTPWRGCGRRRRSGRPAGRI